MKMNRSDRPVLGADSLAIGSVGTFGRVWRSYCAERVCEHSKMPVFRKAMTSAFPRLKFRHVRGVEFNQLSSAGCDVRIYDDETDPLEPEKYARRVMPDNWKSSPPVIKPKIAILREAMLFDTGTALLPNGYYCSVNRNWNYSVGLPSRSGRCPPCAGFSFPSAPLYFYPDRATKTALVRRRLHCDIVPGRCFYVRCNEVSFRNFGHFVHDVLSLIYFEDLGAIVPGRDRVIAPATSLPMQEVLFRKVFGSYDILQAPPHVPLKVEELMLPSKLRNRKHFNPAAIASLARRIRLIMAPYAGQGKRKVCVSRRDGSASIGRNFANVDAYETRMRELGFDVVEVYCTHFFGSS